MTYPKATRRQQANGEESVREEEREWEPETESEKKVNQNNN